jgi:hypothetical protein
MDMFILERVRELKGTWDIGTQNAWKYVKTEQAYEDLATRVSRALREEGIYASPTAKHAANLCEYLTYGIQFALSSEANLQAKQQSYAVIPNDFVIHHFDQYTFVLLDGLDVEVRIDHQHLLSLFYHHYPKEHARTAFRKTIYDFMHEEYPSLTIQCENQSFQQFRKKPELLFDPNSSNPRYVANAREEMPIAEQYREAIQFVVWISGKKSQVFPRIRLDKMTSHEEDYLLCHEATKQNSYERAEREHTLRQTPTARRIALNRILPVWNYTTPEQAIEETIQRLQERLPTLQKRLTWFASIDAPSVIIEREKSMLREAQYTIWAIHNNRR